MAAVEETQRKNFDEMGPKEKRRWALKQFHPDKTRAYEMAPSAYPTADVVLGTLSRSDSLESWPESYGEVDEPPRFIVPGTEAVEKRTFFLPSTPEEFIHSLWTFKQSGSRDVFLRDAPKHFAVEGGRAAFETDSSLAMLRDSIRAATDLRSLQRLFDATDILNVYSPDELLGHTDRSHQDILALINEAASRVMKDLAAKNKLTEDTVENFPFYKFKSVSGENLQLEWDSDARTAMRALLVEKKVRISEPKASLVKEISKRIRAADAPALDEIDGLLENDARYADLKQNGLLKALSRLRRQTLTKSI